MLPLWSIILFSFRALTWSLQENYPLSSCVIIITTLQEESTKINPRHTKYRKLPSLLLPPTLGHPPPLPLNRQSQTHPFLHFLSLSTLLLTPTGQTQSSHVFSPYSMLFYRAMTSRKQIYICICICTWTIKFSYWLKDCHLYRPAFLMCCRTTVLPVSSNFDI